MARAKKTKEEAPQQQDLPLGGETAEDGDAEEVVLEGSLVCALTGEQRVATPQEETLQSLIEQLHREYGIDFEDMERDVRVECEADDGGKARRRSRSVQLAVYESGKPHESANVIRAVLIAKPGTKRDPKVIDGLDEVLGGLSTGRDPVFGLWTNGVDTAFRMRTFSPRNGEPVFTDFSDFPAPDETLEDLETAERRPLRVASADSLLRAFKRCHDYLYGNQNMRGDRAFWQILYLIFAKILDERSTAREFFVGATEQNTGEGQQRIAGRIKKLFDRVKVTYGDVFEGNERIDLNDRALAYVAGELSRYSLLGTDTDAKGMAYEAITSTTLKRERGQFFTPRNVIRMMVDMADPSSDKKVLDPACGSGGFLVIALAHVRRQLLGEAGCPYPDQPLPKELVKVEPKLRKYASERLFGIGVDPDLRKAARMNMVMNNDGHGNIHCFNSLEFGIPKRMSDEMRKLEKAGGGHGKFDYVFTNPPFGAKIPVDDPEVLSTFDLGHSWKWDAAAGRWIRGAMQKKVPPEILFIEACYKFLKEGTGVMALVLPNGILGNPGEQMELVRSWMLRNMELLASVDLPAEAFLPQVSVQASCVFLRRRHEDEKRVAGKKGPAQRPVFMAIAEKCGHGRRGETTWVRNPDGTELVELGEIVERWEKNGKAHTKVRKQQVKRLADDLPWVVEEYRKHVGATS